MNILLFLIPVSMLFLGLAVWAFIWAVKGRQFEDLDASALDILRDDDGHRRPPPPPTEAPPETPQAQDRRDSGDGAG